MKRIIPALVLAAGLVLVPAGAAQDDHDHMQPTDGMDSGELPQGASWEHTFDAAGEFTYLCHPHPYMTGRVVVRDDAPPGNATVEVRIEGFAFHPAEVHVRPGTTVRWTNMDPAVHTVTETVAEDTPVEDDASTPGPALVAALGALALASAVARRRRA